MPLFMRLSAAEFNMPVSSKNLVLSLTALAMALALPACGGHKVRVKAAVEAGEYATAPLPLKDYEPLSLVFAKSTFNAESKNSPALLYHELMVKAHALGAHDIINVKIEAVTNCEKDGDKNSCTVTRYGSALAIKYTKAIESAAPQAAGAAKLKDDSGWANVE